MIVPLQGGKSLPPLGSNEGSQNNLLEGFNEVVIFSKNLFTEQNSKRITKVYECLNYNTVLLQVIFQNVLLEQCEAKMLSKLAIAASREQIEAVVWLLTGTAPSKNIVEHMKSNDNNTQQSK